MVPCGPDDMSMPNRSRVAERKVQVAQRALGSDVLAFDVHCWGQLLPNPDPGLDYDVTMSLAQAVKISSRLLFGQASTVGSGTWDDEGARRTQLIKAGHLLTFSLSVDVPFLDTALAYAPSGMIIETTVQSPTPQTAQVLDVTLS